MYNIKSLKNNNINFNLYIKNNIWEEQYLFLLKIGKFLYKMPKNKINKNNIIYGCQNKIWISLYKKNNIIYLYSYSDSIIINGIIAIIFNFFNKKNIISFLDKKNINNNFYNYIKNFKIFNIIKNSKSNTINKVYLFIYEKIIKVI